MTQGVLESDWIRGDIKSMDESNWCFVLSVLELRFGDNTGVLVCCWEGLAAKSQMMGWVNQKY